MLPDLLKDLLADPASNAELTRVLRAALLGPVLPMGAGMVSGTAATTIGAGGFGTLCNPADTGDYTFPNSNVGVGTATPAAKLHLNSSSSNDLLANLGLIFDGTT